MDYKSNIWKAKLYAYLRGSMFFSGVLIPFFTEHGGLSFFQVMILQSVFVLSTLLFEIPTGAVADHLGRKASMIMCSASIAFGVLIYFFMTGFWPFLIAEIFWGLGVALMSGAADAFVYDTLKVLGREKESKKVLGSYRSFNVLAIGVAAGIGGLLVGQYGYQFIMGLSFIVIFSSIFVGLTLKEPPMYKKDKSYLLLVKNGIGYFRRSSILKIMTFDLVSNYVLFFFIFWSYQYYLRDIGIRLEYLGLVHFAVVILEVYILNNFALFEKLVGRRRFVFYSGLVSGVGAIILALTHSLYIAVPVIIVLLGFGFSRETLFVNYMNKHIESYNRSTVLSVANMFKAVASAALYPLFGYAVELNLDYALLGVGVVIIIALLFSRIEEEHLLD